MKQEIVSGNGISWDICKSEYNEWCHTKLKCVKNTHYTKSWKQYSLQYYDSINEANNMYSSLVISLLMFIKQHLPPQTFFSHQFWETLSEIIGPTRLRLYADFECFHWTQHYVCKELSRSTGSQVQWCPPQIRVFLAYTIPTHTAYCCGFWLAGPDLQLLKSCLEQEVQQMLR